MTHSHFYRSATPIALALTLWVGSGAAGEVAFAQGAPGRVRYIPASPQPLVERLQPGDEIVEVEDTGLKVTTSFVDATEFLAHHTSRSQMVLVGKLKSAEPFL